MPVQEDQSVAALPPAVAPYVLALLMDIWTTNARLLQELERCQVSMMTAVELLERSAKETLQVVEIAIPDDKLEAELISGIRTRADQTVAWCTRIRGAGAPN